ncbi:hypothetical protein B0I35DRAFT_198711 [Stachybotrys elegans]|uniref:Zn(2)-C6 fungal-type domain-containing protein n=1 Tax=Stachybotrys elegans TaxID=80388 RepID=A0A8K0SRG2_9HYPO|nr:hypothetical protein B0I35DRAFT_198711 [Stachybotrys elegans]
MPGVPTSRGCDGCRKQKKKCDQAKPACGRCSRLNIQCLNAGTRRYAFVLGISQPTRRRIAPTATDPTIQVAPSPVDRLAGQLIARLGVQDVRYDISAYGGFLKLLPQRLGRSSALDAGVDVFSVAFSNHRGEERSLEVWRKYGFALKAVRECLADPKQGPTVNVICAIYLILLVQARVGRQSEQVVSHEEGLVHLVEALVNQGPRSEFEAKALSAISTTVIYASLTIPSIRLSPKFWAVAARLAPPMQAPAPETPEPDEPQGKIYTSFPSLHFLCVGKLPDHLRNPELYLNEIHNNYARGNKDLPNIRSSLANIAVAQGYSDVTRARLCRDYQAAYAMILAIVLATNQILQAFYPLDTSLPREEDDYIHQIIDVAEGSRNYIPFGSGFIVGPLSVACAVASDPATKARATALFRQFIGAFEGEDWIKISEWWRYRFMDIRCCLGSPRPGDDPVMASETCRLALSSVQCSASQNYLEVNFH